MILGNAQLGWCTAALCFILPGHKASSASKCRNIINDGSGASVPSFVIQSKRWESAQDSPRKQGRKKLYGWYVGSLPQFQLWNGKQSSSALQPRTSLQRCTGRSALVLSSFRDPDVDNRAAPFLNPCHALNISSWKRESANDDRLVSDTPKAERGIGVGIDLGTTNSAVAILRRYVSSDDNKETIVAPIILPIDDDGQDDNALTTASTTMRRTVPSVVCFPDPKVVLVGRIAVKKEHLYPSSTYRNVKRIIGTGGQIALENAPLVPNFALHSESVSSLNTKPSNSLENLNSSETVAFTGVKQKIGGIEKYKKTKKQGYSNKRGKLTSHESPASSISLSKQLKDALETPALLSVQFANEYVASDITTAATAFNDTAATATTSTSTYITPEIISAHILRKLFDAAEKHTGEVVTRAVVGVPAYFNDAQRNATERACLLAGVRKVRLIREPEAAALAYGLGRKQQFSTSAKKSVLSHQQHLDDGDEELVLVFDLGGGTFDVSVLNVGREVIEVVATSGNVMLGGSDLDKKIAEYFVRIMLNRVKDERERSIFLRRNVLQKKAVRDALLRSAEQARIYLSNSKTVSLAMPLFKDGWTTMEKASDVIVPDGFDPAVNEDSKHEADALTQFNVNETHCFVTMSRKTMEELCRVELNSLLRPVREVAIMAGALLPGDARPSVVEAAFEMEETSSWPLEFEDFYEEEFGDENEKEKLVMETANTGKFDENVDNNILKIRQLNIKALRREQQRGRKKARDLSAREKKFQNEKRKADLQAATSFSSKMSASGNVKVRDSIGGRPISRIVLVGGATKTPAIGRLLTALIGVVPQKTVNPDEAVALGAAVQVGLLDGEEGFGDIKVVTPLQAALLRAFAEKERLEIVD